MDRIPLEQCIKGRVYRLHCRNLSYGVFNGTDGFIGIRTKFGSRFLFTEIHWDADQHFGTVGGMEDMGIDVPAEIEIRESFPTVDRATGRLVRFDPSNHCDDGPRRSGWVFIDTGEWKPDIWPVSYSYKPLFAFLEWIEATNQNKDW